MPNPAPVSQFGHDLAGTTAARPANADLGEYYFDTDVNHWVVWNGTSWQNSSKLTSYANALAAKAGGGQSGATPITATQNQFTTVASDHDSALLPVSVAGMWVVVTNFSGHILDVYAAASEVINAISALSPYTISDAKVAIFFCPKAGNWYTVLTA